MKYVIVGGSNGIGAALSVLLLSMNHTVVVYDCKSPIDSMSSCLYKKIDLFKDEVNSLEDDLNDCDGLFITAGIGRVCHFNELSMTEIEKNTKVNFESIAKILWLVRKKLFSHDNFDCMVMSSIAGVVSSPLFSIYSATKAALYRYVESVNAELNAEKLINRICCVVATSIKSTSFNGEETNIANLLDLAKELVDSTKNKEEKHFVDKELINRIVCEYDKNPNQFGLKSYEYKISQSRLNHHSPIKIGYLSGTFDLFHIGHLNLLRRAKEYCDYLIVGVHKDASHKGKETFIPFEERCEIVKNIKYVDLVVESSKEDSDDWLRFKYDFLFVGSDYYGTERFKRYEEFFKDKEVKIIYFPYTQGTSSTKLREALTKK